MSNQKIIYLLNLCYYTLWKNTCLFIMVVLHNFKRIISMNKVYYFIQMRIWLCDVNFLLELNLALIDYFSEENITKLFRFFSRH